MLVALVVSLLALLVSSLPFFVSFKIFSFNLFIYLSLALRAPLTRLRSFGTFCDVLSMFVLRHKKEYKPLILGQRRIPR